jgi:hypothetical protein
MNPEKRELYTIAWTQTYELLDPVELALELSDYKEANDIISQIKSKLA